MIDKKKRSPTESEYTPDCPECGRKLRKSLLRPYEYQKCLCGCEYFEKVDHGGVSDPVPGYEMQKATLTGELKKAGSQSARERINKELITLEIGQVLKLGKTNLAKELKKS